MSTTSDDFPIYFDDNSYDYRAQVACLSQESTDFAFFNEENNQAINPTTFQTKVQFYFEDEKSASAT